MIAAMYNVSSSSPTSWAGKTALLIGTYDWQIFTFVNRKKYVNSLLTNVNNNKISLCGSHHCISMHGTSSEEQDLSMHTIILSIVFILITPSCFWS